MLCAFCLRLLDERKDDGFKARSGHELEQADFSNCYFCHVLFRKYKEAGNDIDLEPSELQVEFKFDRVFPEDEMFMLSLHLWGESLESKSPRDYRNPNFELRSRHGATFIFMPEREIGRPPPKLQEGAWRRFATQENWQVLGERTSLIPSHTGHLNVARLAREWFEDCRANHKTCDIKRDAGWWPKRIIFLDHIGGKHCLLIGPMSGVTAGYATVSYCWGTQTDVLKLTSDNLQELRNGIPLARFPLTLRHAIKTAIRLGLHYLWIDALCIMQEGPGSKEDWAEQAGMMRTIYSNAVINIGASSAASSQAGMFVSRDPTMLEPTIVQRRPPGSAGNVPKTFVAVDWELFGGQFRSWPLGKRGWVFQERLLSNRMLHFGPDQVMWECSERPYASEAYPGGLKWPEHWARGSVAMDDFQIPTSKLDLKSLPFSSWLDMIGSYSRMQLTYPASDKLLAISGVAERIAEVWKDEYVAGIFKKTLPWALLWFVDPYWEGENASNPAGTFRAPSWSWASSDGPVFHNAVGSPGDPKSRLKTIASVSAVHVDRVVQSSAFGQLKSASIELHGMLLQAIGKPHKEFLDPNSTEMLRASIEIPNWHPLKDITWQLQFDSQHLSKSFYESAMGGEAKGAPITLVPIEETDEDPSPDLGPDDSEENQVMRGLIISKGELEGTYKRLGAFSALDLISEELERIYPRCNIVIL